jgi:hypothetical protein
MVEADLPHDRGIFGLDEDSKVNRGTVLIFRIFRTRSHQLEFEHRELFDVVPHRIPAVLGASVSRGVQARPRVQSLTLFVSLSTPPVECQD